MNNVFLALTVLIFLIALLGLGVILGRITGKWQIANDPAHQLGIVTVAEGAVFALLGLLIAFTFTGAYERFEIRKMHIIEEFNAIDSAYLLLDMLPANQQTDLKKSFREYLDVRINAFSNLNEYQLANTDIHFSRAAQIKIWTQALKAAKASPNPETVNLLLLPALQKMFEIANLRLAINNVHPPVAIFMLLIGLGVLSGFLTGYSTADSKAKNLIHILCYVLITAFTLYMIIDMEFPRMGLIRIGAFDNFLVEIKEVVK